MTSNIDHRRQNPPTAPTNHHFSAMNLFLSFFHKEASDCSYKNMQNEPNLNNSKNAVKPYYARSYLTMDTWYRGKNEPKTNPFLKGPKK